MGWFGHSNSGGCCCQHTSRCTLLSDNFDRADDTDIGADWDEVAGGAEISGNALLVNANNSRIIAATANSDGPYTHISVSFTLANGAATARVFLGWANTSNFLYATITASSLTVGLQGGAGGSQSSAVTISPGFSYALTVCYDGARLVAHVSGVQAAISGVTAPGTKHGLGCGTANVTFDDFVARRVSESCSLCESFVDCGTCCDGGQPAEVIVDFTAIVAAGDECDNCADLASEFTVPFRERLTVAGTLLCLYRYEDSLFCAWPCAESVPALCSSPTYRLTVSFVVNQFCRPGVSLQLSPIAASGSTCEAACGNLGISATYSGSDGAWGGDCTVPLVLTRDAQNPGIDDPAPLRGGPCVVTFPATITVRR